MARTPRGHDSGFAFAAWQLRCRAALDRSHSARWQECRTTIWPPRMWWPGHVWVSRREASSTILFTADNACQGLEVCACTGPDGVWVHAVVSSAGCPSELCLHGRHMGGGSFCLSSDPRNRHGFVFFEVLPALCSDLRMRGIVVVEVVANPWIMV